MLRTNSKKARENVQRLILSRYTGFDCYDNAPGQGTTFEAMARWILGTFRREGYSEKQRRYYHNDEFAAFTDWCAGLPSALNCDYYYKPAVPVAASILEESEAEAERFSEAEAERFITRMIYRELIRVA